MDWTEKEVINKLLNELPDKIEQASEKSIKAREDYELAKSNYENTYQKIYLEGKLNNPKLTQGDLTALAKTGSSETRIQMIKQNSVYLRTQKDLQKARDEFDATIERSYNYRAELKALKG